MCSYLIAILTRYKRGIKLYICIFINTMKYFKGCVNYI